MPNSVPAPPTWRTRAATFWPAPLAIDGRERLRVALGVASDRPEVVGQIMTRPVRVAGADRSLAEPVPIFSSTGHHHLPVIGDGERLVGILTQTDVVRALAREQAP